MEKLDFKPKTHLFICCRERVDKACCSGKGAEEMVSELKKWIKSESLHWDIKVSRSSCLGYCESGVSACIYPQNQWFHQLEASDLPKIKEMLLKYAK